MKRLVLVLVLFCAVVVSAAPIRPVRVELSQQWVNMGDTVRLDLHTVSPISSSTITLDGKTFVVFQYPKKPQTRYHYGAYIGINRNRDSGTYPLKLNVTLRNGARFSKVYDLRFHNPVQKVPGKVKLNKEKQKLSKDRSSLAKEASIISSKFKLKTKTKYFRGWFSRPAKGRDSSGFGKVRNYDGGVRRSHAGADIANAVGTPIFTPNAGRVVLSTSFAVHGETVMVDHGFGVVTIYNHLSERFVKEGQMVRKGDILGRMGNTGLVSGPHLHWGMSVQNVRVDPMKWVK